MVESLITTALEARFHLLETRHQTALRLLNGFTEGWPSVVIELYADTLVIINHSKPSQALNPSPQEILSIYHQHLPWLGCAVVKNRHTKILSQRQGEIIFGKHPAQKINEHNIWYALDLTINQDTSFYLDTRNLRKWAKENLEGKHVLNTFAYTGSLGVAAMAGGAKQVVHIDLKRQFLNLAKTSYTLNGFPIQRQDFRGGDFFPLVGRMRRSGMLFDCIFLDPPFFSTTAKGRVDLATESARLINKVRPLVSDGGWLIAINNAIFVSGNDYLQALEELCIDGYLSIEAFIPVPEDCAGYTQNPQHILPTNPKPFNHATKIALLKVTRKM